MKSTEINQIFEKFSHMRALVIGDVMLDTYLWGKVERLSPEAPVPVVSVTKRENRLGGAANVSLNIQSLGAAPVLFSVVGDDDHGKELINLLQKRDLNNSQIFVDASRCTTVKNRIISNGKQIVRVDEESTNYISQEVEWKILDAVQREMESNPVDVIIFVDYDKGMITPTLFEAINKMAIDKNILTAVDPKKRNFRQYKNVDLFKPNFKEFVEGIGVPINKNDLEAIKANAGIFQKQQNLKMIFITLSELGVFISNGVKEQYCPVVIRDIADVSGAGDTVISVASLAMASGLSPKMMAMISNLAGGLVCEKAGVVPVNKEQLEREMKSDRI